MTARADIAQLDLLPRRDVLGQWMTPEWAAEELVARFFGDLGRGDLVVEPSCGRGAFLKALPAYVPAIGVEIDPALAAEARANSGREIITGDFRHVAIPTPTAIVGNPPYEVRVIEAFLARAKTLLPADGRCGFLLPAYAMQTHRRVMAWHRDWSLRAELVPRRLFPRLRLPLVFVLFAKTLPRTMVGFCLYPEAVAVENLTPAARAVLADGKPRRSVWRALVEETLRHLGGKATLAELYHAIEPRRPTPNPWWREKVRQTVQLDCRSLGRGVWALPEAA